MGSDQQTLRDLLTTQARRFEKKTFLEYGGQHYSYRALDELTDRVATGLTRLGLQSGDKVALLLENCPEFLFFFLGAPKVGMIPVPISPALPYEEILYLVRHSGAVVLVTESRFAKLARRLRDQLPGIRHEIVVDAEPSEEISFQKLTRGPVLGFWPDLDPDDEAAILYTRGSAGLSRGAVLTHRNFVSNCAQPILPLRINDTDRFVCFMPLCTVTAQVLLVLTPWAAGASCVLRERFSSDTILQELSQDRITVLAGAPEMYSKLVGLPESLSHDLSALRLALCTSGSVNERTRLQFEERYDALIVEVYGVVEATCITCANPYTGVRKPGSVGLPLPGQECRILNELGKDQSSGDVGEIAVRGPNVMKAYYKDPAATAQALRDGWLHTGDRGYIDVDGYYYLVR